MNRIVRYALALSAVLLALTITEAPSATAEPAPLNAAGARWDSCQPITWQYQGPTKWRGSWDAAVAQAAILTGLPLVEAAPGQVGAITVVSGPLPDRLLGFTQPTAIQRNLTYPDGRVENVGQPHIVGAAITLATSAQPYFRAHRKASRAARWSMLMIHELGHALGLGHSTAVTTDVMSEHLTAKSLRPDDVAAFQSLAAPCIQ